MYHSIRIILFVCFISLILGSTGCHQAEKEQQLVISTEYGDITILLYNSTPKHRDILLWRRLQKQPCSEFSPINPCSRTR